MQCSFEAWYLLAEPAQRLLGRLCWSAEFGCLVAVGGCVAVSRGQLVRLYKPVPLAWEESAAYK